MSRWAKRPFSPALGSQLLLSGLWTAIPVGTGLMSVTHTALQTHSWWQVDLGEVYSEISGIEIWNRTDSNQGRLDDFYVFVSDVPFVSGDLAATLAQSGVWSQHQVGVPDPKVMLPVGRSGRYVRIQLADTNYLTLAEVKVFATA